jgi:hypothetical protein
MDCDFWLVDFEMILPLSLAQAGYLSAQLCVFPVGWCLAAEFRIDIGPRADVALKHWHLSDPRLFYFFS